LSDNFPIQNSLKQDALLPLLIHFALEYAIRKIQEKQVRLYLNRTHQLPICIDDANLLRDDIDTVKKNTDALIDASKEFGLEVNTEKTKYMLLSCHQNAEQNHDIKVANRCFENMAQFRYLGTPVTNQNLCQEEINRRLNSSNACYHSVRNILASPLLSKDIKIRIYKTVILLAVLNGCETYSDIKGGTWTENI
jgi:hypothetical protein